MIKNEWQKPKKKPIIEGYYFHVFKTATEGQILTGNLAPSESIQKFYAKKMPTFAGI